MIRSKAPGRVNLIGDHTDYTGGLVLPMAIDLATTVEVTRGGDVVRLSSDREEEEAVVPIDITPDEVAAIQPMWARYVAGVVAEVRPTEGAVGTVTTTLPIGGGLSSSAALGVAVAGALGFKDDPVAVAQLCQRAEERASGVPCGIMDQLTATSGVAGALLLIDCRSLEVTPIVLQHEVTVIGIHSGQVRTLAGSAYADRRAQCEAAERQIGPLRDATAAAVGSLRDPVLRSRARHVITETARVTAFCDAIKARQYHDAGALMATSHASLRDDFEVSTPAVDDLVARVAATQGVFGARMTGGGFGGVVVALCDAEVDVAGTFGGWRFRPSGGATVETRSR